MILKSSIKKTLLCLGISLFTMTPCFSNNIYKIEKDSNIVLNKKDLKEVNQIFLEHRTMSKEIPLLKSKINNLLSINTNLSYIDSIRTQELKRTIRMVDSLKTDNNKKDSKIIDLKSQTKRQKKAIFGLSFSTATLALLLLL